MNVWKEIHIEISLHEKRDLTYGTTYTHCHVHGERLSFYLAYELPQEAV